MPDRVNALVVSGGGSLGAFAVGAIDHMIGDLGLEFDIVAGTSTGALIAPLVAAGGDEWRDLKRIFTSVDTGDILIRRRESRILGSTSVYSTQPLARLIAQNLTAARADRILRSTITMLVTTVSLQSGRIVYFYTGPRPARSSGVSETVRANNREEIALAILASASQPVLMPPVHIPAPTGEGDQYVDGGVKEYAPIDVTIDNGATHIYAVVLTPPPEQRAAILTRFDRLIPIAERTLDLLTNEIKDNDLRMARLYNQALAYTDELKERVRERTGLSTSEVDAIFADQHNPFSARREVVLHVISPTRELGDALRFNPDDMALWLELGRNRAREVLSAAGPVV
jgi:predicted acylesterase/phospholipase RssA